MPCIALACALSAAIIGGPTGEIMPSIRETSAVVGFAPGKPLRDDGWREKIYNRPARWEVVEEGGCPILHGTSDGSASMLYRALDYDANAAPLVSWRWKAVRLPKTRGVGGQADNDYGARVYFFFPGWSFLTSYALQYVWDNESPPGTIKRSPTSSRCRHVVATSGTDDLGKWVAVERNLRDDFTRAFGWAPDRPVGGIGFMTDSDNTSSSAEAYYGPVTIGK